MTKDKTVFTGVFTGVAFNFRSNFGGDPGRTPSDFTYEKKFRYQLERETNIHLPNLRRPAEKFTFNVFFWF